MSSYEQCPICSNQQMINDYDICHECGFESGYDDATFTHEELRGKLAQDKNYFWFYTEDR